LKFFASHLVLFSGDEINSTSSFSISVLLKLYEIIFYLIQSKLLFEFVIIAFDLFSNDLRFVVVFIFI
jgi:hypothetical protein